MANEWDTIFGGDRTVLSWLKKPHLIVEVLGHNIVVAMPGTSYRVVYAAHHNKLVASTFSASKVPEEKCGMTLAKFLGLAWPAANAKAKKIGLIG